MAESRQHKILKNKAAGKKGKTEVKISGGRRVDALSSSGRATEVERSGSHQGVFAAARRLRDISSSQNVLQVPHKDIPLATKAMKKVGVKGTVRNLSGTKRKSV